MAAQRLKLHFSLNYMFEISIDDEHDTFYEYSNKSLTKATSLSPDSIRNLSVLRVLQSGETLYILCNTV